MGSTTNRLGRFSRPLSSYHAVLGISHLDVVDRLAEDGFERGSDRAVVESAPGENAGQLFLLFDQVGDPERS